MMITNKRVLIFTVVGALMLFCAFALGFKKEAFAPCQNACFETKCDYMCAFECLEPCEMMCSPDCQVCDSE